MKLKKIFQSGVLLGCFASVAASADVLYQPAHPGFFAGFDAGIMKESSEGTAYTSFVNNAGLSASTGGSLQYAAPGFEFAPGGFIGYLFKNQDDLSFSFLINDNSVNNTATPPSGYVAETTLFPNPLRSISGYGTAAYATNLFSYETSTYNILMGHWFSISSRLSLHPTWGLGIADLSFKMNTKYFDPTLVGPSTTPLVVNQSSSITGVGPMLGLNGTYALCKKLSLIWGGEFGLLAGENRSSLYSTSLGTIQTVDLVAKSPVSLFESIQANAGMSYAFKIAETDAALSAGYRVAEFFNSVDTHSYPGQDFNGMSVHAQGSTGFMGPFIDLSATI